jgi:hypothetical protein
MNIETDIENNCLICDNNNKYKFQTFCDNCVNFGYRKCMKCKKFVIRIEKPYWVLICKTCFND